jgi:hypothetical protein
MRSHARGDLGQGGRASQAGLGGHSAGVAGHLATAPASLPLSGTPWTGFALSDTSSISALKRFHEAIQAPKLAQSTGSTYYAVHRRYLAHHALSILGSRLACLLTRRVTRRIVRRSVPPIPGSSLDGCVRRSGRRASQEWAARESEREHHGQQALRGEPSLQRYRGSAPQRVRTLG